MCEVIYRAYNSQLLSILDDDQSFEKVNYIDITELTHFKVFTQIYAP